MSVAAARRASILERAPAVLAVLVAARLVLHALYLPAFEGPDEPFHLARVEAFRCGTAADALTGQRVPAPIIEAVRGYPCAEALRRQFGCPAFGAERAAFNLLGPPRSAPPASAAFNNESNQPPLYYSVAALVLGAAGVPRDPPRALLAMRLLNAALVLFAILGPLRRVARGRSPGFAVAGLVALLAPGASEALVRGSNDAAVFLWAALVVAALEGRARSRTRGVWIVLLAAAGPLLKLTAFAVVAFAAAALSEERRRWAAAAAALASCSVFAVQALRGWRWGGTLELNLPANAIADAPAAWAAGLARSAYACVKTTLWLGGWTTFRAPVALVAAFGLLLAAALRLGFRRRPARRPLAHAAGVAVAAAGFLVFAIANRRLYGVWGGVGGWYVWGWAPWLAVAADDLLAFPRRAASVFLSSEAALVAAANVLWFVDAARIYLPAA